MMIIAWPEDTLAGETFDRERKGFNSNFGAFYGDDKLKINP